MNEQNKIATQAATCHVSIAADQLDLAMKQLESADSVLFASRIQDIDTLHECARKIVGIMLVEVENGEPSQPST